MSLDNNSLTFVKHSFFLHEFTEKDCSINLNRRLIKTQCTELLSIERNPFITKNQTLRPYRVYILPTRQASSALIQIESRSCCRLL